MRSTVGQQATRFKHIGQYRVSILRHRTWWLSLHSLLPLLKLVWELPLVVMLAIRALCMARSEKSWACNHDQSLNAYDWRQLEWLKAKEGSRYLRMIKGTKDYRKMEWKLSPTWSIEFAPDSCYSSALLAGSWQSTSVIPSRPWTWFFEQQQQQQYQAFAKTRTKPRNTWRVAAINWKKTTTHRPTTTVSLSQQIDHAGTRERFDIDQR